MNEREKKEKFCIPYRVPSEYIPVDVQKLRPKDSYKKLIQNRTHAIDGLVKKYGKIPGDLLKSRGCPTCGANKHKPELQKDHMDLVRCLGCDLVYVNPIFDEEHYEKVYKSEEYQDIVADLCISSHEYRVERFGKERVGIMKKYIEIGDRRTVKYLDVGCSTGFMIEAAQDAGWNATGIDLNPSAVDFGKTRGLNLLNQALEDTGFAQNSFDAISFFCVLEHLMDPKNILKRAVQLLKKRGIIFIYVPNYDSAARLLIGKDVHCIWPTHHLSYYTPRTISDLAKRMGLNVEMLLTEGLDMADCLWYIREIYHKDVGFLTEIADQLQFLINAGCYGNDLRVIARKD